MRTIPLKPLVFGCVEPVGLTGVTLTEPRHVQAREITLLFVSRPIHASCRHDRLARNIPLVIAPPFVFLSSASAISSVALRNGFVGY